MQGVAVYEHAAGGERIFTQLGVRYAVALSTITSCTLVPLVSWKMLMASASSVGGSSAGYLGPSCVSRRMFCGSLRGVSGVSLQVSARKNLTGEPSAQLLASTEPLRCFVARGWKFSEAIVSRPLSRRVCSESSGSVISGSFSRIGVLRASVHIFTAVKRSWVPFGTSDNSFGVIGLAY